MTNDSGIPPRPPASPYEVCGAETSFLLTVALVFYYTSFERFSHTTNYSKLSLLRTSGNHRNLFALS